MEKLLDDVGFEAYLVAIRRGESLPQAETPPASLPPLQA